jgi:hypothetical protein
MGQPPGRITTPLPVYLIHWRQPAWCTSSVRSVLESDLPVEVIVVNNSPELATSLATSLGGSAQIVSMPENLGYTGAANYGLASWRQGTEPYVVIASHDLHVERDALRMLVAAADQHPEFGILGPVLTDKLAGANVLDEPSGDSIASVRWVSGTCMLLRRACIDDIGNFDEALGSYVEDVDMCLRARRAGWEIGLVRTASAHGLGTGDRRMADRAGANAVLVMLRNEGRAAAFREWLGILRRATARTLWAARHWRGADRRMGFERAIDAWGTALRGSARLIRGVVRLRQGSEDSCFDTHRR